MAIMSVNSLAFWIEGTRPTSKKNNLRVTRNGAYTARRVSGYEVALQAAALEAMQAQGFAMLVETPFALHFHMAVRSYGSIDMDNAITTALDALQGVVYDNDKYCCKIIGTKALLGKNEVVRTEIRIEVLD
jgi:Holliday junction resolvase RusA-like endonuclease